MTIAELGDTYALVLWAVDVIWLILVIIVKAVKAQRLLYFFYDS